MGQPATILFLGVSSSISTRDDLDREAREIDQRLRSSEHREAFRVAQAWAARASDLQGLLLRYSPAIVHFSGHGDQGGALVMEGERGGAVPVSAANLADLFRILHGPTRCVVLSASYSEVHAKAVSEHVDCVIGMTKSLPGTSAIAFAGAFYQGLGYGRDVWTAFELGRNQIDLTGLQSPDAPKLHARPGVEPRALRIVHHPETRQAAGRTAGPALHQLRAPPADFTGRGAELADLRARLAAGGALITGITGQGGIGKTALALKLAQELHDQYPDAQIDMDLKGSSAAPLKPAQVMAEVIHAFEPGMKLPDDLEVRGRLYRSILAGKRALLLFDNAVDREQVQPLIPPPGCLLLVTSRQHFCLPGFYVRRLDMLEPMEAIALIQGIASRLDEAVVRELAKLCGYLPLALRATASALAERVDLKPERYIERLRSAQERMKLVEAALSSSLELLDEQTRELWLRLGVMPAEFDATAAAAVGCGAVAQPARPALLELKAMASRSEPRANLPGGAEAEAVSDRLGELVRRSLLDWDGAAERYRMHDLARDYARSLLAPAERYAAERCHADHYMRRACRACLLYEQGGPRSMLGLHGFDRELEHIAAAQAWALAHSGADKKAAIVSFSLPLVAADLLALRLPPRERLTLLEGSLAVALRLNARAESGRILCAVGNVYADIGEVHKAIEYYGQAIAIAREVADASGEGKAQRSLGGAYLSLGEPRRAMEAYDKSYRAARELGDERGEAHALRGIGSAHMQLGSSQMALDFFGGALQSARRAEDRVNEGRTLVDVSIAYRALGEMDRSIGHLSEALRITREVGDRRGEGSALGNMGAAYAAQGDARSAIRLYEQHLIIADETSDRGSSVVTSWNLGKVYEQLGDLYRAASYMQVRIDFERSIGHRELAAHEADLQKLWAKIQAEAPASAPRADLDHLAPEEQQTQPDVFPGQPGARVVA